MGELPGEYNDSASGDDKKITRIREHLEMRDKAMNTIAEEFDDPTDAFLAIINNKAVRFHSEQLDKHGIAPFVTLKYFEENIERYKEKGALSSPQDRAVLEMFEEEPQDTPIMTAEAVAAVVAKYEKLGEEILEIPRL